MHIRENVSLNLNVRGMKQSPTIAINDLSNSLQQEGKTVYRLGLCESLAEVARKYKVILLSDEIYGALHHQGKHISAASFYPEGTIISSGLSKWCGAGGWRLGTFAFPQSMGWLADAMAAVASETFTAVSAPIQYAAVRAFEGDIKIERYLWQVRRILSRLAEQCVAILRQADIDVHSPDWAFYLFPSFSRYRMISSTAGARKSSPPWNL